MNKRIHVALAAALVAIGGGLLLAHPAPVQALDCTVDNANGLATAILDAMCGGSGSCDVECSGGQIASVSCACG